ncbi:uncharacterized protein CDV56_107096 [Aspergillus thermomutatus]|uniref:LD-carboxypeptidase N-terminal domain-containing protein n=1 Tax=Aspergillus thermomutatus TaxID=41047 RepID=A0A397HUP5_ASPTH|nr:uncharacterized protein CDV56_107096 [Aspergillus thermomutatus]RHZ64924.1 hypothetical protein CDV56_107096 [Aspergillus thermomutatus]
MTAILPKPLKKGATIAFVSPSLRLNDVFPTAIERGKAYLESLGFQVEILFTSLPADATIADSVRMRCDELHKAFLDSTVTAIICTCGGSHANELLSSLDYALIRSHPKIFVGYTDITFLHFAIQTCTGLRTFYGPTVLSDLSDFPAPMSFTIDHFLHVLSGQGNPVGPLPRSAICTVEHNDFFFGNEASENRRETVDTPPWRWIRKGRATGHLYGGTVVCVVRLLGSPYVPSSWKGKILFLETAMGDDMHRPYNVANFRKSLADLALAGVLRDISGLVIGRGYKYDEQRQDDLAAVILQVFDAIVDRDRDEELPILMNVDFGHTSPLLTLPLGRLLAWILTAMSLLSWSRGFKIIFDCINEREQAHSILRSRNGLSAVAFRFAGFLLTPELHPREECHVRKWTRQLFHWVFNDEITAKWRKEIQDSGEDVSERMMEWIIKEAQWKAEVFHDTKHIVAFDVGVVKSDIAIPEELRQALKEAVRPLEEIPEDQRDYHPGTDGKVVDLVHPSLFPVIYGRTRILPDRLISLKAFANHIGEGKVLPVRPEEESVTAQNDWDTGTGGTPIDPTASGFNGYPVTFTLDPTMNDEYKRIEYSEVDYDEHPEPEPEPADEDEEDSDEYWDKHAAWQERQPIKLPEPGTFIPHTVDEGNQVNLRQEFAERGLQVIMKLANIELTPEKPEYEGGSWHIEGQLNDEQNEHICATAIYYYESENITESTLAFRQRARRSNIEEIYYEQSRHEFLQQVFGFGPDVSGYNESNITQLLGGVETRQGRLLTFPNILQHRVAPFSLADRSKPGHRKILAFFLVDPHQSIISSANVPPQQEDWWKERQELVGRLLGEKLPAELQIMVKEEFNAYPITMEEAKQY